MQEDIHMDVVNNNVIIADEFNTAASANNIMGNAGAKFKTTPFGSAIATAQNAAAVASNNA